MPPFPDDEALAIVERELGKPLDSVFEAFEKEPVAAASLGQVYRATLRGGRRVAVKVQRPGCEATIALDLYILRAYSRTLTGAIALLGRDLDLVSVIDDFGQLIYAELDYSVEVASARRFRQLYGNIPNVSAPEPVAPLCTRVLLTSEWVDGVRLTDKEALERFGLEPAALVDTLVQCTLRQATEGGMSMRKAPTQHPF